MDDTRVQAEQAKRRKDQQDRGNHGRSKKDVRDRRQAVPECVGVVLVHVQRMDADAARRRHPVPINPDLTMAGRLTVATALHDKGQVLS